MIRAKSLLNLVFHRPKKGTTLEIEVGFPIEVHHYSKLVKRQLSHLESSVTITKGKKKKLVLGGRNELEILLHALDLAKRLIPEAEENEWVDSEGVASWVVLPKRVPVSWGYGLYHKISKMCDEEEAKFTSSIEKKRRRANSRKT